MSIEVDGYQLFGHKGNVIHHSMTYHSLDADVSVSVVINHSNNKAIEHAFSSLFSGVIDHLFLSSLTV